MKKGIWSLVIEYFLAAPILGIPCYAIVSVWATKNDLFAIGVLVVAAFYGFMAFYQLKRVSISGREIGANLFLFLGSICTIMWLFILLKLVQVIPSLAVTNESTGTGDPTTINSVSVMLSSFGFGFLLGLSILFLGYFRLEHKMRWSTDINNQDN